MHAGTRDYPLCGNPVRQSQIVGSCYRSARVTGNAEQSQRQSVKTLTTMRCSPDWPGATRLHFASLTEQSQRQAAETLMAMQVLPNGTITRLLRFAMPTVSFPRAERRECDATWTSTMSPGRVPCSRTSMLDMCALSTGRGARLYLGIAGELRPVIARFLIWPPPTANQPSAAALPTASHEIGGIPPRPVVRIVSLPRQTPQDPKHHDARVPNHGPRNESAVAQLAKAGPTSVAVD